MLKALPEHLRALTQDKFLRAASVLAGGSAAAQGIGLLALPLLTRFYTPEDFSLLAVYVAVLTMTAAVTCMRLDVAIPLPESEDEAAALLAIALMSAAGMILVSGVIVVFFGPSLAMAAGWPEIATHLWLVPFGIGLMGLYSSFQYMATRQKAFKLIARTKMLQAVIGLGSQIGLGLAGIVPLGLLLGHALMSGAGVLTLARQTLRGATAEATLRAVSFRRMCETLHTYRRFPQFAVAEELSNSAGIQLPVLLIASLLAGPEGGLLFLAMRAVGTPMTIVGSAVAQVYYSHAAQYEREGRLTAETTAVFRRLSRMLVIPMLVLGPFAPDMFRLAFGPEWERAGTIVIMMLPWYALRLIASPISMVMHVKMRQRQMLAMTLVGLGLRVLPLLAILTLAPDYATLTFAVTSAFFYGSIVVVLLTVAGLTVLSLVRLLFEEVFLWTLFVSGSFFVLGVIGLA